MVRSTHGVVMVAAAVLATVSIGSSHGIESGLPSKLEGYVSDVVRLTADERQQLLAGAPVTKLLNVNVPTETAVFGAIWINAPIHRYVEQVKDIENFERNGGFKITKRISPTPRLEDFAGLHLPDEDVSDLQTCRVGNCRVKLSERSLERFRTEIDWSAPDARARADALMQRITLDYVNGYLVGGNERLPVYRDRDHPTFVGREFHAMIDQMPELPIYMPDLRRFLLDYPRVSLPGSTSFLYWQETDFGLKPTIRISHLTIREGPHDTVVASKMLYASHYFLTGIELRVLLPDPSRGPGFWFVTANRSRSDGLTGFRGLFVRPRVRSEVYDGALAGLQMTKKKLERPH